MPITTWGMTALCLVLAAALAAAAGRLWYLHRRLRYLDAVLEDILQGHMHHRALAHPSDPTARICYHCNALSIRYETQLARRQQAEEANRQMLVNLSHDVRTPLTTLLGYLDAVHRGLVTGAERENYIETARCKALALKSYLDALFVWGKLNAGAEPLSLQRYDLAELTRGILKDWVPVWEEAGLHYAIELPEQYTPVKLDREGYARILNNLLGNVLSHSEATELKVLLCVQDGKALVSVKDNGVGIAPQDLPHIFERLYTADRSRRRGSGLGLEIAKKLTERMGGRISVSSIPRKETSFTVCWTLDSGR